MHKVNSVYRLFHDKIKKALRKTSTWIRFYMYWQGEVEMNVVEKAKGLISSVKTHWNTPPEGRYIPYKEIMSYSVGGIGVKFVISIAYYIGLSGTNLLAGSALRLKNDDLVTLSLIATVLNLLIVQIGRAHV